jgi:hypothetical protein
VMARVGAAMDKAQALLETAGFGKACYGDVQVTKTVHKKGTVSAFYWVESDDLFVRANVPLSQDILRTICHELGHRWEYKFAERYNRYGAGGHSSMKRADELYGQARRHGWEASKPDEAEDEIPSIGDKTYYKGKTYVVAGLRSGRTLKVMLSSPDVPGLAATTTVEGWKSMAGKKPVRAPYNYETHMGYVSDYARSGGEGENFAEMFAFYCMGRIPEAQAELFEEVVFGAAKTAEKRKEHRFAAKWILEGVAAE